MLAITTPLICNSYIGGESCPSQTSVQFIITVQRSSPEKAAPTRNLAVGQIRFGWAERARLEWEDSPLSVEGGGGGGGDRVRGCGRQLPGWVTVLALKGAAPVRGLGIIPVGRCFVALPPLFCFTLTAAGALCATLYQNHS